MIECSPLQYYWPRPPRAQGAWPIQTDSALMVGVARDPTAVLVTALPTIWLWGQGLGLGDPQPLALAQTQKVNKRESLHPYYRKTTKLLLKTCFSILNILKYQKYPICFSASECWCTLTQEEAQMTKTDSWD